MRSDPLQYANKEQYQFVSSTKENMAFGFGRHACPGRFFAATEIKMLLARLLLEYDIRMPDGVQHRYENIVRGDMIEPDHTKTMMVRKATAPKEWGKQTAQGRVCVVVGLFWGEHQFVRS